MKSKEYIEEMKNIKPSEELIQKTISNIKQIKEVEKMKKSIGIKRILIGATAFMALSAGTVGAYAAITGNIEILEKIGIKLSQNYDENKQEITTNYNEKNRIIGDKFEAEVLSVALDEMNIVMEISLKLNEEYNYDILPDLDVMGLEIIRSANENSFGEQLQFSQNQSTAKMEDGTYKIYKYISVVDPNLGLSEFWNNMFAYDDSIDCIINFSGLYDDNGNLIEKIDEENSLKLKIEKPSNLENMYGVIQVDENLKYKNVEATVTSIQVASFGNIINIDVYENDIDINKINDIQKINFDIKDKKGNKINIISRTENVTFDNYANGKMNLMGLELHITVDDTDNYEYDIEMFENEKETVSKQKVREAYDVIMNLYQNSESTNYETEELYTSDSVETSIISSETYKIYKTYGINKEDVPQYIIVTQDEFYIGENENDTFLYGTYEIEDNNDNQKINLYAMSQDYAFLSTAEVEIDNIYGKDYIIFENGDESVYFEHVNI